MKFKVPISWVVQSHVTVVADSREEAAEIAESMGQRPMGCYVDNSLAADRDNMERMLPRSIENPRNFMQPFIYQGDVIEVEENGDHHIIPMEYMSPGDEALKNGRLFKDVYYGRLSADGYLDCTMWVWGNSEEEVLSELEDLFGDDTAQPFKLIEGGKA